MHTDVEMLRTIARQVLDRLGVSPHRHRHYYSYVTHVARLRRRLAGPTLSREVQLYEAQRAAEGLSIDVLTALQSEVFLLPRDRPRAHGA